MRAKHLIEELQKLNPNTIVFCQDSTAELHGVMVARNPEGYMIPIGILTKMNNAVFLNSLEEIGLMEDMHNYKI